MPESIDELAPPAAPAPSVWEEKWDKKREFRYWVYKETGRATTDAPPGFLDSALVDLGSNVKEEVRYDKEKGPMVEQMDGTSMFFDPLGPSIPSGKGGRGSKVTEWHVK